jgi:hypothetical protein
MNHEGWIPELEESHFQNFLNEQEVCGEEWYVDFSSVKERIYEEADVFKHRNVVRPSEQFTYKYIQNSSNGCAAIAAARTVEYGMELMTRKKKEIVPFRVLPAWTYACYHALVAKDFSYGGCSISGILTVLNKYGVLPYDVFGKEQTDLQMVQLGWNKRMVFPSIFEKYSEQAEKFQVKITKPETFADLLTCIEAGYSVEFGTNKRMQLGKDGVWTLSGSTNHAMNYAFSKPGYIGSTNSWTDGFGWLPIRLAERQWNGRFDCFVVLEVERTRKGKANYGL